MKTGTVSKAAVLGLAVLLTSSAFAAHTGSLQVKNVVMVNGTELQPGAYKVRWEGASPDVEISIVQHGKVVATLPGHVSQLQYGSSYDAAVLRENGDRPESLIGVHFLFQKTILEFGEGQRRTLSASNE